MRIQLLWSFYDHYLDAFYAARPGLATLAHAVQLDALLNDGFGWPPAVGRRLIELGHDVEIVVANAKPLQQAWAAEAGVEFPRNMWQMTVSAEQVRRFAPDVLWTGSNFRYFGDYLRGLKRYCRAVVAWTAAPLPSTLDLGGIDCMVTSHENFAREFRARGLRCERVLPCFEPRLLESVGTPPRDVPASFVGSLTWAHDERIRTMTRLVRETPLEIWTGRPRVFSRSALRPAFWRARRRARDVLARSHADVYGLEMYRVLARSQVVVNVHIGVAGGLAGNMRMFEATGCGALLLTERMPNLGELFEPDTEVLGYTDTDDLVRQLRTALERPESAAAIAARGKQRTLREHSAATRARTLADLFADLVPVT